MHSHSQPCVPDHCRVNHHMRRCFGIDNALKAAVHGELQQADSWRQPQVQVAIHRFGPGRHFQHLRTVILARADGQMVGGWEVRCAN